MKRLRRRTDASITCMYVQTTGVASFIKISFNRQKERNRRKHDYILLHRSSYFLTRKRTLFDDKSLTAVIQGDVLEEREQCLKWRLHCFRKRAAPVRIQRLGFEPQGKQMCATTFSLSELVYNGSEIVSAGPGGSAELFSQKRNNGQRTHKQTIVTNTRIWSRNRHFSSYWVHKSVSKNTHTPVGPRPCSMLGLLTHWESYAGSHQDKRHRNCNLPTGALQPGGRARSGSNKSRQKRQRTHIWR